MITAYRSDIAVHEKVASIYTKHDLADITDRSILYIYRTRLCYQL